NVKHIVLRLDAYLRGPQAKGLVHDQAYEPSDRRSVVRHVELDRALIDETGRYHGLDLQPVVGEVDNVAQLIGEGGDGLDVPVEDERQQLGGFRKVGLRHRHHQRLPSSAQGKDNTFTGYGFGDLFEDSLRDGGLAQVGHEAADGSQAPARLCSAL